MCFSFYIYTPIHKDESKKRMPNTNGSCFKGFHKKSFEIDNPTGDQQHHARHLLEFLFLQSRCINYLSEGGSQSTTRQKNSIFLKYFIPPAHPLIM